MNKKGFTTVELILTMFVVIVIMSTITSVTYTYRDRSKYEEILTDITDYKNTVTKIIYDDIFDIGNTGNNKITKIEKVNDTEYEYNFISSGKLYKLNIINNDNIIKPNDKNCNQLPTKVGILYDGIEYIIPYSNNSDLIKENNKEKCKSHVTLDGIKMYPSDNSESNIYALDILFTHKTLEDKQFKIHLILSK